jgi:predicted SnoaL-like aldol condensation-catalyzing enzyme
MNNKEMAISFLRLASSGNVREAYETYDHPQFRHHNPYFPGDRASLLARWRKMRPNSPTRNLRRCALLKTQFW